MKKRHGDDQPDFFPTPERVLVEAPLPPLVPPPSTVPPLSAGPLLVYWHTRTVGVVLRSILGARDLPRRIRRDWLPYGVVAWALAPDGPWHALEAIPPEWGLTKASGVPIDYSEFAEDIIRKEANRIARKRLGLGEGED